MGSTLSILCFYFLIAVIYTKGKILLKICRFIFERVNDLRLLISAKRRKAPIEENESSQAMDKVIDSWIAETNDRGSTSGYSFFKNGEIVGFRHSGNNPNKIILEMQNGKEITGTIKLISDGSAVETFSSDDRIFEVYGKAPVYLKYKVIKRDVEDLVQNDMYKYIDASIIQALQEGSVIFDAAEGLEIPKEEFIEKYDTPQYQKAWDHVLKSFFQTYNLKLERLDIGRYSLNAA